MDHFLNKSGPKRVPRNRPISEITTAKIVDFLRAFLTRAAMGVQKGVKKGVKKEVKKSDFWGIYPFWGIYRHVVFGCYLVFFGIGAPASSNQINEKEVAKNGVKKEVKKW